MAKRQTVWLSTMMILSLMVIGYYTVDETVKPVPTTTADRANQQAGSKDNQVNGQPALLSNSQSGDQAPPRTNGQANGQPNGGAKPADRPQTSANDWFAQQFIKRETEYGQRVEELQKVIADANTPNDKKVEAQKELSALQDFSSKAEKAEDKLVAEGYPEALVTKNGEQVNVTVQASDLTKERVVKILLIVSQEIGVPANQVVVSYKP